MARAIAQGNVNPVTMEAYSPSQATRYNLLSSDMVRVSSRQRQNKRVAVAAEKNNFLIFSVESDDMDVGGNTQQTLIMFAVYAISDWTMYGGKCRFSFRKEEV